VTARLSLRERQIFVTLRVTQYFVTVKIYTLVSGCQPHTIQIVRLALYKTVPDVDDSHRRNAVSSSYLLAEFKGMTTCSIAIIGGILKIKLLKLTDDNP